MRTVTVRNLLLLLFAFLSIVGPPVPVQAQAVNPCPHRHPSWEGPCEIPPQAHYALAYLATTHNVPIEILFVFDHETHSYPVTGRSIIYFNIWVDVADPYMVQLAVDLADNSIITNIKALEDAERAAAIAKYGKLSPMLYDILEQTDDETKVPVGIWLGPHPDGKTEIDFQREIAARYPAAQAAMDQGHVPWAVEDQELSRIIYQAYRDLVNADIAARAQSLLDALTAMDAEATLPSMLPSVLTSLTKPQLQEIVQRSDVGYVDWTGGVPSPGGGEPVGPLDKHLFLPLAL